MSLAVARQNKITLNADFAEASRAIVEHLWLREVTLPQGEALDLSAFAWVRPANEFITVAQKQDGTLVLLCLSNANELERSNLRFSILSNTILTSNDVLALWDEPPYKTLPQLGDTLFNTLSNEPDKLIRPQQALRTAKRLRDEWSEQFRYPGLGNNLQIIVIGPDREVLIDAAPSASTTVQKLQKQYQEFEAKYWEERKLSGVWEVEMRETLNRLRKRVDTICEALNAARCGLSFEEAAAQAQTDLANLKRVARTETLPSFITKRLQDPHVAPVRPTYEVCRFVGAWLANRRGGKGQTAEPIYFTSKDGDLISSFYREAVAAFPGCGGTLRERRQGGKSQPGVFFASKRLAKTCNTLTKYGSQVPWDLMLSKRQTAWFLSGFCLFNGRVLRKYGGAFEVAFTNRHSLAYEVAYLFRSLGFIPSILRHPQQGLLVRITGQPALAKLEEKGILRAGRNTYIKEHNGYKNLTDDFKICEIYNEAMRLRSHGLGSTVISRQLGMPIPTIANWLNGRVPPLIKRIALLNQELSVRVLPNLDSIPLIARGLRINGEPLRRLAIRFPREELRLRAKECRKRGINVSADPGILFKDLSSTQILQDTPRQEPQYLVSILKWLEARGMEANSLADAQQKVLSIYQDDINRCARKVGQHYSARRNFLTVEELEVAGSREFVLGIDRWNPNENDNCFRFLMKRVRGAMYDEIRQMMWIPRRVAILVREYKKSGIIPESAQEIVDTHQCLIGTAQAVLQRLSVAGVQSLHHYDRRRGEEGSIDISAPVVDPAKDLVNQEAIIHSLSKLNSRWGVMITLHYSMGWSHARAARLLGISEDAFSTQLYQARQQMAKILRTSDEVLN